MIVGRGLIAQRFNSFEDRPFIIFASGISNSGTTDLSAMQRELELVRATINDWPDLPFVYFSTYSVDDPSLNMSSYVRHKMSIETFIRENARNYHIIRTSNIVGESHSNRHTIINFIYDHILNDLEFDLWSGAYRNVLDIDHLYQIVEDLLSRGISNAISYVINPVSYKVSDIVQTMEEVLGRKARYRLVEKGVSFNCDTTLSSSYFDKFSIGRVDYLKTVIHKYYSPINGS